MQSADSAAKERAEQGNINPGPSCVALGICTVSEYSKCFLNNALVSQLSPVALSIELFQAASTWRDQNQGSNIQRPCRRSRSRRPIHAFCLGPDSLPHLFGPQLVARPAPSCDKEQLTFGDSRSVEQKRKGGGRAKTRRRQPPKGERVRVARAVQRSYDSDRPWMPSKGSQVGWQACKRSRAKQVQAQVQGDAQSTLAWKKRVEGPLPHIRWSAIKARTDNKVVHLRSFTGIGYEIRHGLSQRLASSARQKRVSGLPHVRFL